MKQKTVFKLIFSFGIYFSLIFLLYYFESNDSGSSINTIWDSLWYSLVTLTTVGYGTGALLGRGVTAVQSIHWKKEIGLAQAMWVLEVKEFGPFLVESDLKGNSLFERENTKIERSIKKAYEGTRPPSLKRFGEINDRTDELI